MSDREKPDNTASSLPPRLHLAHEIINSLEGSVALPTKEARRFRKIAVSLKTIARLTDSDLGWLLRVRDEYFESARYDGVWPHREDMVELASLARSGRDLEQRESQDSLLAEFDQAGWFEQIPWQVPERLRWFLLYQFFGCQRQEIQGQYPAAAKLSDVALKKAIEAEADLCGIPIRSGERGPRQPRKNT
jgi:hypothetical protein